MADIFCKIVSGEIPSNPVLEGKDWIAINDIHPQAPVHILIIPKKHIAAVASLEETDSAIVGSLLYASRLVAEKTGIAKTGFRVIINHGEDGGQTVPHLHVHVLGGKNLGAKMIRD